MSKKTIDKILIILFFFSTMVLPIGLVFKSTFISDLGFHFLNSPIPIVFFQDEIAIQVEFNSENSDGSKYHFEVTKEHIQGIKGPIKRLSLYLSPFFIQRNPQFAKSVFRYGFCDGGSLKGAFDLKKDYQKFDFLISYRSPHFDYVRRIEVPCQ